MKIPILILQMFVLLFNVQAQNQDSISIKKFITDFGTTFNQKDAKGIAKFWSEDGDFLTYFGNLLHGREEIEKYHQTIFVHYYQVAKNKLLEPTIRFIKPDVAAVDVRWEVSGATTPDGKPRPTFKGIMVWTMTKENNNWYIKIMHNLSLPEGN